jgi:hypothetical protein
MANCRILAFWRSFSQVLFKMDPALLSALETLEYVGTLCGVQRNCASGARQGQPSCDATNPPDDTSDDDASEICERELPPEDNSVPQYLKDDAVCDKCGAKEKESIVFVLETELSFNVGTASMNSTKAKTMRGCCSVRYIFNGQVILFFGLQVSSPTPAIGICIRIPT